MPMTKLDRDHIFFLYAGTELARAIHAIDAVTTLCSIRVTTHPGVERREWRSVFDQIRFALQSSANVSKIFWPHKNAAARGARLRSLAGLPEKHYLTDRKLRNHIEHMDERLDDWLAVSPHPFLTTEMILYSDQEGMPEDMRDEIINATPVVYDERTSSVMLFGDVFLLDDIRKAVIEVQEACSKVNMSFTSKLHKVTGT